ncbi:MAG TPA: AAA family ATPase, partial [Polyangiaceae bacterium]|nr:AAA family ATPase [Polyangiaceae bacterium]
LKERLGSVAPQIELANEIGPVVRATAQEYRLAPSDGEVRVAARYLVEELAADRPRFVASPSATALKEALMRELDSGGGRRDFEDDLRLLEKHPAERLGLASSWMKALIGRYPDLAVHAPATREAAVLVAAEGRLDREPSSALVGASVTGILGQHSLVKERALEIRLDEWLAKLDRFSTERVPRFRKFRKTKIEILDRERKRLRLDEFTPKVLSSFVRNQLIDKVYLPLVGDNLAKQMGSAGEGKRTDQMGMLLLISPPGYGKTTLMEYVANRMGLIFMKVNGPALGHEVTSIDPNDAPNATARQEVDKINLALEMGNNVMLYLDDIQHTHPELLQKFISLCDAQRRIEGVWKGRTRTYDMRGKRFCVVMAGNPYTESGEKFKIPDMLANRADTYNLGDILEGKDDLFALSYIENALTSNKALSPLAGREPADTYKLIRMAQGEAVALSELSYPYSAAEVNEVVEVLKRLFRVQKTLLRVNLEYIASASQDDNFRTEPPFKLQGSYRNMNKVTEKIVAAHTEDEVERVVEDHYAGESQTLTTGAEHNLLKLAELRGRLNDEQRARWAEIRKGFVRVKMMGGKDDDPTARVTGTLAGIGEQLSSIDKALSQLASGEASRAVAAEIDQLGNALAALANREVMVQVEHDPTIAELLAKQLGTVESSLAPLVKAVADSLLIASHGAQSTAKDHAAALEAALGEAVQKVEQVTAAQRELASSSQAQAQAIATAREVVAAQQAQLVEASNVARQAAHAAQQAIGAAHQLGADAQNLIARESQLLAQETQLLAQQQRATAHAYASPAGAMPAGSTLVQRPDASPEENEAIARAQLAAAAARSSTPGPGGVQPEVGAAVFRVEHRLGELTQLVRALQDRLSQGVVQAASLQSEAMASAAEAQRAARGATTGNGGGGAVPRFDAAVDFESPSNFYRWKPKADVVNEGGVFISTRRKLPNLGQNVLVRLTLPGGVELEARAVVEWTRPVGHQGAPGFGARFVDLPTYGRQLVDHFVARREPILFEQA